MISEMILETIAWAGNIFLMAGQFLAGRKAKIAPVLCNVGNAFYIVYAAEKHAWALLAITVIAFAIMLRNAILWRKDTPCRTRSSANPSASV